MKTIKTSEKQSEETKRLLALIDEWTASEPVFDTKSLAKNKCWPITTKHYKTFSIKKRNGTERQLVTVDHKLKEYQSKLRRYLEKNHDVSQFAYGFVSPNSVTPFKDEQDVESVRGVDRPRGVVSNALAHAGKKVVISIDLKDFFPSITFPRIVGMLIKRPYGFSHRQAAVAASIVCLPKDIDINRGLPQGAPSSPLLSNLICKKLDYQLGKFAAKYDLTYTRYADDLTISTNNVKRISPQKIIDEVTRHVRRNGFQINVAKTKIMYRNMRQMVTGILVNDGLNLHKKHVDALKATLYNLEHKYDSVEKAIMEFWKLKNKRAFDAFLPIGFYKNGSLGRFLRSPSKGVKHPKPITKDEMQKIYALHLLGRIHWYGQVVCTAVNSPYDLDKRSSISPKQYARIKKYEEMLGAFYRIAMKFEWPVEHVVLRLANKLTHLQTLIKTQPYLALDSGLLSEQEKSLKEQADKLKSDKSRYETFFTNAPKSLQRALIVHCKSHSPSDLDKIKMLVEQGWPDPKKQRVVCQKLDMDPLDDLFHKSTNGDGHSVKQLVDNLSESVSPNFRYLSKTLKQKLSNTHKELLRMLRSFGDDVRINIEKPSKQSAKAVQAIRDLKSAVRLYENDTDNFYQQIALSAVSAAGMENAVEIDRSNMEDRVVTDIKAWRDSLKKVLDSIKQHMADSERVRTSSANKPYVLCFNNEDPVTGESKCLQIFRRNTGLPFTKVPKIDIASDSGQVKKWIAGGDLTSAAREFLPVGDLLVHGSFKERNTESVLEDITVNLTEHSFHRESVAVDAKKGRLMFTLREFKD
ncbi:reverse transcriptase family protein [Alteromonas sp. P256]|uniref:reverse transcriptase family protein n=1 Tax=Alteromonas sp. P256 TaxID=3117399 RepID=UPI002FE12952